MSNGAQALLKTLVDAGITTCFTNPGTSEMHFVAALDTVPEMRAVLALFEGVATGAADGYARMADKPAATLLHLGCGLGNGLANLHNAPSPRSSCRPMSPGEKAACRRPCRPGQRLLRPMTPWWPPWPRRYKAQAKRPFCWEAVPCAPRR